MSADAGATPDVATGIGAGMVATPIEAVAPAEDAAIADATGYAAAPDPIDPYRRADDARAVIADATFGESTTSDSTTSDSTSSDSNVSEPAVSGPATELEPASTAGHATVAFNPAEGARYLFADLAGNGEQTALLLDGQGLVVAGTYFVADGRDVAEEVGAALSGVSDEANRAMRHLELGDWTSIMVETDATTVAMGPLRRAGLTEEGIALVAAARSVPLGFVRRLLQRVTERGISWLGTAHAGGGS
jgi:predicted regulator of Ras-like GTPase activity (Roadblock/LC7/MglB family)